MRFIRKDMCTILISSTLKTTYIMAAYLASSSSNVVPFRMNGAVVLTNGWDSYRAIGAVRVYLYVYPLQQG